MKERTISIEPEKREEYLRTVDQRFRQWHQQDWEVVFPSFDYFRDNIAKASFIALVGHVVNAASPEGIVNLSELERSMQEQLGEYFREYKLQKAVTFVEEGHW